MGRFAELLDATINTKMDLHREYAADFGISEAELEATEPPTVQGHTDFLVRTAAIGTFGDTVAALLPCGASTRPQRGLTPRAVPTTSVTPSESKPTPARSSRNSPSGVWT
ncbi:Transcriptional activator TenA [Halorhabdus sp. SVX81]|nr:hypothetical protein [Halorhabdus sp. SVX81]WEL17085.1 Transcriptional activator TenA [Halorhabdus sp. SVX81]WEL20971.1 Transcriptional activator TenA [Halorhabdus sp. BNX81]